MQAGNTNQKILIGYKVGPPATPVQHHIFSNKKLGGLGAKDLDDAVVVLVGVEQQVARHREPLQLRRCTARPRRPHADPRRQPRTGSLRGGERPPPADDAAVSASAGRPRSLLLVRVGRHRRQRRRQRPHRRWCGQRRLRGGVAGEGDEVGICRWICGGE
jgi:hypothetical protein